MAKLEARIAAVRALHAPFGVLDECGQADVCRHCHTFEGAVREGYEDAIYPCETLRALGDA